MSAAAFIVPEALSEREQWLVWRWEWIPDRDKWTKVPYRAKQPKRKASSTDRSTWATFEEAVGTSTEADGIGIAVTADDPLVGIDFDDCIDEDGELDPWVAENIATLDSYTEHSPSGRGLRVFVKGKLTGSRRKRSDLGFEVYDDKRFFTVTGDRVGVRETVEERQSQLDALYAEVFRPEPPPPSTPSMNGLAPRRLDALPDDRELLDRAFAAKNGAKVEALYRGEVNGYSSRSEADLAFCGLLAFWTGPDPARIDRLFRSSGLMRPKWDERRGDSTYGQQTVETALRGRTEFYEPAVEEPVAEEPEADARGARSGGPSEETQAEVLIRIGAEAGLFTTPEGESYATFEVDGHRETWPLRARGSAFRLHLVRRFHARTGKAPQANAVAQAMEVLDARARFEGATEEVHTRVAHRDGRVYLDLADDRWRVVEVAENGWRIVEEPPVRFRRAKGQKPLPEPVDGGSLEDLLAPYLNVVRPAERKLLIGWLLGTLTGGPYPLAALHGGQGTAKSTATRCLRRVVDPSVALTRSAPKDVRDLSVALQNSHVLALDNLSWLPDWLSDGLCRVATGAGFATRALFTDDEEAIFDATRPVVMNGIEDLAVRGDLLDRCLVVNLRPLSDAERREEREVEEDFARAHPRILGALLDAVACSLRRRDELRLDALPRMADFTRAVEAAAPALGWADGEFLDAYTENRGEAVEIELDASPIGRALVALVRARGEWSGPPADLLRDLERRVDDETRKAKSWPKTARGVSAQVRRLAGALRACGIEPSFGRSRDRNRTRRITLGVADGSRTVGPAEEICSSTRSADGSDGSDGRTGTPSVAGKMCEAGKGGEEGSERERGGGQRGVGDRPSEPSIPSGVGGEARP